MPQHSLASLAHRIRATGQEAAMTARLARDLPAWLRQPLSLEQAGERVRHGLTVRAANFLDVVERAIYRQPNSPYLRLLRHAGCELGDLRRLVAQEGVEGALAILAERGVYVTFEELKGRREIVRGSARFSVTERDFDSPLMTPHWLTYTSGTRGQPGAVMRSLPLIEEITVNIGAMLHAHGVVQARHAYWLTNPIGQMLIHTKLGQQPVRWLQPLSPLPTRAWLGSRFFALAGRLGGTRLPLPRFADLQQADLLATWLSRRPRDGRPLALSTIASSAVRVAVAAREAGIGLEGVTFLVQSEPVTEARRDHLLASGARVVVNYGTMEAPTTAYGCATARTVDDVHVFDDRFALIGRERLVTESGPSVNALLVTSLTDHAGKILFNAEPGDYAVIERRACECYLGELGLTTHLSGIRSFEKLSGEGVTFARSTLVQVLDEALPARFGGTGLDYQLVEEEAPDSATRLVLRVSPAIGPIDEAALRAAFLAALAGGGIVDRSHAELLRRAGSVVISRQAPLATTAGKVLPFHLARRLSGAPR